MITGFNTDIEHDGVVYHVQTEDKGLATPFILSLVYVGGAILVRKTTPYEDLIAAGDCDAGRLADRLQRQHKLICAAINAGRIEDLRRLSQRESEGRGSQRSHSTADAVEQSSPTVGTAEVLDEPVTEDQGFIAAEPPPVKEVKRAPDAAAASQAATDCADGLVRSEQTRVMLHLSLLEEKDLYAGEVVTLRIRVSRGPQENRVAVANAAVTVKVLGSEFRPLILNTKSDEDGVATVHAWLPRFSTGRAAVLVRAIANGYEAELRRLIHPV
ncbi:MAG: hypothetical protein ACRD9R_01685 [Pyrinomonadaceae bacterium]